MHFCANLQKYQTFIPSKKNNHLKVIYFFIVFHAHQVTPSLGVIAALLILLVVREPPRGHTDGQRSSKGVKGKSGFVAYLMDVLYCLKKLVPIFSEIINAPCNNII